MNIDIDDILRAILPVIVIATGLSMIFAPKRWRRDKSAEYERQIADRLRRGEDAYFEELRALRAYAEPPPPRTLRIFGIAFLLIGGAQLTTVIFK